VLNSLPTRGSDIEAPVVLNVAIKRARVHVPIRKVVDRRLRERGGCILAVFRDEKKNKQNEEGGSGKQEESQEQGHGYLASAQVYIAFPERRSFFVIRSGLRRLYRMEAVWMAENRKVVLGAIEFNRAYKSLDKNCSEGRVEPQEKPEAECGQA
jgi:hypothetical protein